MEPCPHNFIEKNTPWLKLTKLCDTSGTLIPRSSLWIAMWNSNRQPLAEWLRGLDSRPTGALDQHRQIAAWDLSGNQSQLRCIFQLSCHMQLQPFSLIAKVPSCSVSMVWACCIMKSLHLGYIDLRFCAFKLLRGYEQLCGLAYGGWSTHSATTFNLVEVLRSKYALLVHIEIDHGPLFEPQMTQMLRHKIAADTPQAVVGTWSSSGKEPHIFTV